MKKNNKIAIIIISIILLAISSWTLFYYFKFIKSVNKEIIEEEKTITADTSINEDIEIIEKDIEKIQKDEVTKKLENIKKKLTLKWIIDSWDMYYENYLYNVALVKYLQAYKNIPEDEEINLKIWDLYYSLKRFDKSTKYYSNVKDSKNLDKEKYIYSYINSNITKSWWLDLVINEINTIWFDEEKKFYFNNSFECLNDFHTCRENFWNYFDEKSSTQTWGILDYDLANINEALINYENFQLDELIYKSALIIWAYYENGFYYMSLELSKKILEEYPDYKPLIKIAAKSNYELWDYINAKNYLQIYKKLDSNDAENSYFLWRVYEKLDQDVLSIIQYDNALKNWYKDKLDILRRLAFIYYDMNEEEKMLMRFKEIIESWDDNITLNDYNLAIYYHIMYDDLETAEKYSISGKIKFPESEMFYAYYAWIILQKEEISDNEMNLAKTNIEKAIELNTRNPMVTMVNWIYEFKNELYDDAFMSFKRTISQDKSWDYESVAEIWLDKIKEVKK